MNIFKKSLLYTLLALIVFSSFLALSMDQKKTPLYYQKNKRFMLNNFRETLLHKSINLPENLSNISILGDTSLHTAILNKKIDILQRLLDDKADPNIQDKDGCTPIYYAIESTDNNFTLSAIKLLIENKADPSKLRNCFESCSVNVIYDALTKFNDIDTAVTLLKHGAHPVIYLSSFGNMNVFHWVAKNSTPEQLVDTCTKCIGVLHDRNKKIKLLLLIRQRQKNKTTFGSIPRQVFVTCILPYLPAPRLVTFLEQQDHNTQTPCEILQIRANNDHQNQEIYKKAIDILNPDNYR